jgi:hypothetical protein
MRNDRTTAETRLADYLLGITPAATDTLTNLMLGGYFAHGRIWTLHSRFRYFDPERRRAGMPADVAALVEKLDADAARLVLVNVNAAEPRTVVVQAGGYAEHQFEQVRVEGRTVRVDAPSVAVRLEPGAGALIEFRMRRYANQPTLAQPFNAVR